MKSLIVPFIALSIAFASCNGGHEEKKAEDTDDTLSLGADSSGFIENVEEEYSYTLPSALQIAHVLKKSGANYIATLPNKKENSVKYNTTSYKKAINFGVYSADLSYCLINKKYQESKDYLKVCREVGGYLGISKAFEVNDMAQRFDKNISHEDSVVKIVSQMQLSTDIMFEQNKQRHIAVIAFAGAWIESAYIAEEIYRKDKSSKVLVSFMEQMLLAETILKALKIHEKEEPEISELIASIEKINSAFNSIAGVKAALENDEVMDFNSIAVTNAEVKLLSDSFVSLRKSIIE